VSDDQPGLYPQHRFEALYGEWKRRARLFVLLTCAGLLAYVLVISLAVPRATSDVFFLVLGGCAVFWLAVIPYPPWWIEKWRQGYEGERRTAKALRPLEAQGWLVRHGLKARYGDTDHIVVGPPGVFLLESKSWTGLCVIENGHVVIERGDNTKERWTADGAMVRSVTARSAELRKLVNKRVLIPAGPGIVVLWCDFPQGCVDLDGVTFVHGDRVYEWLADLPVLLRGNGLTWSREVVSGLPRATLDETAA
jgi:hypothetical protein